MIHEYNIIINNLKEKINKLLALFREQKNKIVILKETKYNLEIELKKIKEENTELKENYKKMKLANELTVGVEGDKNFAKIQINKLVREIDKCIALLNK